MAEKEFFSIDSLAEQFASRAMHLFAKITPEARQVQHRLEEVAAAMRAAAGPQVDMLMAEVRKSPWLSAQLFALATLEVAEAGKRKVMEIIEEEKK